MQRICQPATRMLRPLFGLMPEVGLETQGLAKRLASACSEGSCVRSR
jgi:hypothetical protein